MKLALTSLAAAGLVVAAASASNAQESGFFIGVEAGYDRLNDAFQADEPGFAAPNADGLAFRSFVGYDKVFESGFLLGAEIGSTFATTSARPEVTAGPDIKYKSDFGFNALTRLGWTTESGNKFYALGGIGFRELKVRVTDTANGVTVTDKETDEVFEWGAGAEFPYTDEFSIRLRLTTYGDAFDKQFNASIGSVWRF